jgi:hypothetical protein
MLSVKLGVGDIIVDRVSGEVGLLLYRYDILYDRYDESDDDICVWAWEIFWAGPRISGSRYQSYTEFGLENMVVAGTFELYKCI